MTTTDDTTSKPARPSVFERTDALTGKDEQNVRATFNYEVWDEFDLAFRLGGSTASILRVHRALIYLDRVAEGTDPIAAKSEVEGMRARDVLEHYPMPEKADDPDSVPPEQLSEAGKDEPGDEPTPPASPDPASPPA